MDGKAHSKSQEYNHHARLTPILLGFAIVFGLVARVSAQSTPFPEPVVTGSPSLLEESLEKTGSISFRKTPISEVVFLLSELWKVNIVASDSMNGEVSGVFHNATLREVLSSTLTASGYGYRVEGNSMVVLPLDQLAPTTTGSVDTLPQVTPNDIAYFTIQYTDVEELVVPLREALSASTIIAAYAQENRLMVRGTPDELRIASDAVAQLDRPRQQVRITALIYDVGLEEIERLGINWTRNLRSTVDLASDSRTFTAMATASALSPEGTTRLAFSSLSDNFNATVLIEALDNTKEAKLLANPSITVSDRREASIQIVKRLPIIGSNPVAGSNAVFTQVEFVDAGVILRVTPRISRDETIEMKVQPEFSVQVDSVNDNPVIDSRSADTTVRVANGHTFALGGLRQKSTNETVRGVPYLKDIRYIGALFRSHNSEVRESELIVFLKPELVDPAEIGKPREEAARRVAECELAAIPYASHCRQSPDCKDPLCPIHHPRTRINGGSSDLSLLGGDGLSEYPPSEDVCVESLDTTDMP